MNATEIRAFRENFKAQYGRYPTMAEMYRQLGGADAGLGGLGAEVRVPSPRPAGPTGAQGQAQEPPAPTSPDLSPELEAILEDFRNALAGFITEPGFITEEGGVGGWGMNMADWMRRNQDLLGQQFLESYMGEQFGEEQLQEYTPVDWLSVFDPQERMRMTRPSYGWEMPAVTTRRLRG